MGQKGQQSQVAGLHAAPAAAPAAARAGGLSSSGVTVCRAFVGAVKALMLELEETSAHFVRCIRPELRSANNMVRTRSRRAYVL